MTRSHEIFFFISVILRFCVSQIENPEVQIEQGIVKGGNDTTINGRPILVFKGIPYAQPPVGALRFMEPQPPLSFNGVYDATSLRSNCLQLSHMMYNLASPITGEEDCLYLNIYTPILPNSENFTLMEVIVFIHGGAFMYGSGNGYTGTLLLDNDVIFVSLNYRLGALGFLSTEDDIMPGNNGLKDQIAALKWIQKNIAAFGGNPKSVTIFGNSAGGASVHFHYFSPLSKGLFHRGFSNSGSALSQWAFMKKGKEKAMILGETLGCPTNTSQLLINCLRGKPAYDIAIQAKNFLGWLFNPFSPFAPLIERWGNNPVLNEDPYKLLQDGNFQQLPWMTSVTSEEGLYPAAEFIDSSTYLQELNDRWDDILPHLLDFNFTVAEARKADVCKEVRYHYLKYRTVPEDTVQLVQLVGDRLFVYSAVEAAKLQAASSKAPVYFYRFSYRGNGSLSNIFTHNFKNFGVSHADDISYIMVFGQKINDLNNPQDREMTNKMLSMMWSYAKTGFPTMANLTIPNVKEFLPNLAFLNISSFDEYHAEERESLGYLNFWKSLPFQENINMASSQSDSSSVLLFSPTTLMYIGAALVGFIL